MPSFVEMNVRSWKRARLKPTHGPTTRTDIATAATASAVRSAHGIDTVVVGWGYGRDDFTGAEPSPTRVHVADVTALREVLGV